MSGDGLGIGIGVIGITLIAIWSLIQFVGVIALIWLSWRYFDRRYKTDTPVKQTDLLSGALERTAEVYIDPNDGIKYRVYYNRGTGEREYIKEV